MKLLHTLLAPDRSALDWLRRHGLYWLVFSTLVVVSWYYWAASLSEVLRCALPEIPLLYLAPTYLLLYAVLPRLLAGQRRAFAWSLLGWLVFDFALRGAFDYLSLLRHAAGGSLPAYWPHWRELFDPRFMVTNDFVIVAAALKVFRHHHQKEQAIQQLTQQTLAAELQALKAQLQPHFLFNMLNSIYSLALRRSPQAGPAVRRLSGLLGELLGHEAAAAVPLTQEIALLRNYLALEQLRYGARLRLDWQVAGEVAGRAVAPLLLLPFVENACKHGVGSQAGPATIEARLTAGPTALHFVLRNSRGPASPGGARPGGLGLLNVRRRLALLYPGCHTLRVQAAADAYTVELTVPLTPLPELVPAAGPAVPATAMHAAGPVAAGRAGTGAGSPAVPAASPALA